MMRGCSEESTKSVMNDVVTCLAVVCVSPMLSTQQSTYPHTLLVNSGNDSSEF